MSFLIVEQTTYAIGTTGWWSGLSIGLGYAALVVLAARLLRGEDRVRFERIWGFAILALMFFKHGNLLYTGQWSSQDHLEMQLCGFSRILAILLLVFRQSWAFYPLFFWGIVGGLHAFLTPQYTAGASPFMFWEYNLAHAGIMIVPLYHYFVHGFEIKRWTWAKMLVVNIALMVPVGLINKATGANYMFLSQKPIANNPFIVGEWPTYILGFVAAGALHYALLTVFFARRSRPIGVESSSDQEHRQ
jgi:hypothetical integral membrane protein (TIGR02206 family)